MLMIGFARNRNSHPEVACSKINSKNSCAGDSAEKKLLSDATLQFFKSNHFQEHFQKNTWEGRIN